MIAVKSTARSVVVAGATSAVLSPLQGVVIARARNATFRANTLSCGEVARMTGGFQPHKRE